MDDGRAAVAERERGAAEPIFAERDALRAGRRAAQRKEVAQGVIGLVQESQRDPAGEELRLDIGVARDEPVLDGDLVGDRGLPGIQRARGN